jgi:transposase
MEALLLKSHGLPHAQIARILRIGDDTLHGYLLAYQEGGIEKLKELNWQGSPSELARHQDSLKEFFCSIPRRLWPRRLRKSPS